MGEFFNKKQRLWVGEALEIAEFLAEDNLKIDLTDSTKYFYDLRTLINLRGAEKTDRALAQVCKYEYLRPRPSWAKRSKDFYRICLQDDKILKAAAWKSPLFLRALILYVITHELIHVIRFSEDPRIFHLQIKDKRAEEKGVHRLTHNLLKGLPDPQVNYLLECYRPMWDEEAGAPELGLNPLTNSFGMPNFLIC